MTSGSTMGTKPFSCTAALQHAARLLASGLECHAAQAVQGVVTGCVVRCNRGPAVCSPQPSWRSRRLTQHGVGRSTRWIPSGDPLPEVLPSRGSRQGVRSRPSLQLWGQACAERPTAPTLKVPALTPFSGPSTDTEAPGFRGPFLGPRGAIKGSVHSRPGPAEGLDSGGAQSRLGAGSDLGDLCISCQAMGILQDGHGGGAALPNLEHGTPLGEASPCRARNGLRLTGHCDCPTWHGFPRWSVDRVRRQLPQGGWLRHRPGSLEAWRHHLELWQLGVTRERRGVGREDGCLSGAGPDPGLSELHVGSSLRAALPWHACLSRCAFPRRGQHVHMTATRC